MLVFWLLPLALAFYAEQLHVRPLSNHEVLSNFNFTMQQSLPEGQLAEYTVFPRVLGQIMRSSKTQELHVRFGHGVWDADRWGAPPANGLRTGASGVEIWAFVDAKTKSEALRHWNRLVNHLGGYFCASLSYADENAVTFPSFDLLPPTSPIFPKSSYLMRAVLPDEPVCTENLTPFLKLLPCRNKAGLGGMLSGQRLFGSTWQSMGIDVIDTKEDVYLEQTVSMVSDLSKNFEDPLPWATPAEKLFCDMDRGGGSCIPLPAFKRDFNLNTVFGDFSNEKCMLGQSLVSADVTKGWTVNGMDTFSDTESQQVPELTFNFDHEHVNNNASEINVPPVYVDRSLVGWGMQHGGVRTLFTTPKSSNRTRVRHFEAYPHFVRLYMHTLKLSGDGEILNINYIPSNGLRSGSIELELELGEHAVLEFEFEKSLLMLHEYPPDPNHGFEIAPALTVVIDKELFISRTPSLLLPLPVPDFSMPYNVIIMTSTIMGLAFGTLYNLFSRDVIPISQVPQTPGKLQQLVRRITRRN